MFRREWKKFNTKTKNNSIVDIFRNIDNHNTNILPYKDKDNFLQEKTLFCCRFIIELKNDCLIDIGEYLYIDKDKYPKINMKKGARIICFHDKQRNGYCFDQIIDNMPAVPFHSGRFAICIP